MSVISDFASNSVMGVVRKIVNHITGNIDPTLSDAVDHLPSRFHGTFDDNTRNLQLTIESQGTSTENLVATVNIPGGGGSGGPTYTAGNGINITSANAIEIDPDVTATVADVDTRVAKNQGTANAGKVLGIGSDGMVVPVDGGGSGLYANKVKVSIKDIFDVTEIKSKLNISETGNYNLIGQISISSYNSTYGVDPTFINYTNCMTLEVESSEIVVKSNGPSIVRLVEGDKDNYYLGVGFYYYTSGNTSFKYQSSYGTTVVYNIGKAYKRKGMEITGILYKIE